MWMNRRTEPWPNRMGVTHPLAKGEDDSWRVSIAEIDAGAPFSNLPDVHRQFVCLGPAPIRLYVDGQARDVPVGDVTAFSGGSHVRCEVNQPALALNVMSRIGAPIPNVRLVDLRAGARQALPHLTRGLFVILAGSVQVTTPEVACALAQFDALELRDVAVQLEGIGRAALILPSR